MEDDLPSRVLRVPGFEVAVGEVAECDRATAMALVHAADRNMQAAVFDPRIGVLGDELRGCKNVFMAEVTDAIRARSMVLELRRHTNVRLALPISTRTFSG